jgi:Protein phosphatase 2C
VSGARALTQVRVAERAAGTKPTQDRTVLLERAVAVLDGASAPDPAERDGGWYATQLAAELAARLEDRRLDLATVLADAIAAVTSTYRLVPGHSPSSTVTLLRWEADRIDGLVLGDSPLVIFAGDTAEVVVDERLEAIAPTQRVAYHDRLAAGGGYDERHRELLRALVGEQRRHRNRPDGYWIAEATPTAARQALTRSWPAAAVSTALLASDGVSRGIGRAVPDWTAALRLIRDRGPDALLDAVRAPEQADPDGRRWPRSKPYDDQALVVVTFRP